MNKENKRAMSKPQSIYMWENVDKTTQRIDSLIDLFLKTTDLYDPQYIFKDNEDYSLKSLHIIGEFVHMKKTFEFAYGFKSHNEFLPPSKIFS